MNKREYMEHQLFELWDNARLYEFLKGPEYVEQLENEITKSLDKRERLVFIGVCREFYEYSHKL